MNSFSRSATFLSFTALLLLPSCKPIDWLKEKFSTGFKPAQTASAADVLLTVDGTPMLTVREFETFYDQVLEQQPQMRSFAAMMPDLKENLYSSLVGQKLLEYWAQKSGITQRPEYQADRKSMIENIDRALAIKYFQAEHPMVVSDDEVKKFYEENKNTMYVMTQGGVSAVGVSFEKEDAAKAFLAKAQQGNGDLSKLASESKLTVRNFGKVHEQTAHVDADLRSRILAVKKVPSVSLMPVGSTYWVVQVTEKDATKYYPFEQAKEDARARLSNDRMMEMFNTEIEKLRQQYKVIENKDYFESSRKAAVQTMQEPEQPEPMEELPEAPKAL